MSDSKTARASAVKAVKEKHIETQEEAIKALRLNLDAGLHFGDISRVRHLLARYDEAVSRIVSLEFELGSLGLRFETLDKSYNSLDGQYDALDSQLGIANRRIKELEAQLDGELSGPVPLPDSTSGPCQAD